MQSKNPIFRDIEKQPGFAYNEGVNAYQAAGAGTATLEQPGGPTVGIPAASRPMTIDDVVTKTAMAFVVLVIGAGIGWVLTPSMPWLPFAALIAGLAPGEVAQMKRLLMRLQAAADALAGGQTPTVRI